MINLFGEKTNNIKTVNLFIKDGILALKSFIFKLSGSEQGKGNAHLIYTLYIVLFCDIRK